MESLVKTFWEFNFYKISPEVARKHRSDLPLIGTEIDVNLFDHFCEDVKKSIEYINFSEINSFQSEDKKQKYQYSSLMAWINFMMRGQRLKH